MRGVKKGRCEYGLRIQLQHFLTSCIDLVAYESSGYTDEKDRSASGRGRSFAINVFLHLPPQHYSCIIAYIRLLFNSKNKIFINFIKILSIIDTRAYIIYIFNTCTRPRIRFYFFISDFPIGLTVNSYCNLVCFLPSLYSDRVSGPQLFEPTPLTKWSICTQVVPSYFISCL